MAVTWDEVTYPIVPEFAAVTRSPEPNLIAPKVAKGAGKRRRRLDGHLKRLSMTQTWSKSTYESFETYFEGTLDGGVELINFTDEFGSVTGSFYFDEQNPYDISMISGLLVKITLNFIRVA